MFIAKREEKKNGDLQQRNKKTEKPKNPKIKKNV